MMRISILYSCISVKSVDGVPFLYRQYILIHALPLLVRIGRKKSLGLSILCKNFGNVSVQ